MKCQHSGRLTDLLRRRITLSRQRPLQSTLAKGTHDLHSKGRQLPIDKCTHTWLDVIDQAYTFGDPVRRGFDS
ncbi:hypothetical protein AXFE_11630 [Acidithrix ferrooxidans]|uniref:Uncharacterized protein n=1 Tax=Acidithrix ferrooxidans TaxID=1280514 RepID=A0A0D8HJM2_9ACTN|nr:hypothetical protein AXFE_11630 [Acidithrix ferrooxidans]